MDFEAIRTVVLDIDARRECRPILSCIIAALVIVEKVAGDTDMLQLLAYAAESCVMRFLRSKYFTKLGTRASHE